MKRDRKGRHGSPVKARADGQAPIYGWHSALAALRNPRRTIRRVLATPNAAARLAELGEKNPPEPVDARELDRVTGGGVHQGIVVFADPLPEADLDALEDAKLVLVLDQVTDPHNVGAILRTAAAFGADALVLTERHGPADSGVLAKAASGGLEHVALVRVKNLARALDELGDMGFWRIGLDSGHTERLKPAAPGEKIALVLGAEGSGMRRLTREKCDALMRIALPGPIGSLNVSNAAAVALYALAQPSD